jgi:hypothetical protein
MKFQVKYALGGGYGGTDNCDWETIEANSLEEAERAAYEMACEVYESQQPTDFAEEYPDADDEELAELEAEDRESWIDYIAQPYNAADDEEVDDVQA